MSVTVRIPTPLRKITGEQDVVSAGGDDLAALIADLESNYPGMKDRLVDEGGEIRRFVNVFINGEDVRFLDGLGTAINTGDEISIVPAVAGGDTSPTAAGGDTSPTAAGGDTSPTAAGGDA